MRDGDERDQEHDEDHWRTQTHYYAELPRTTGHWMATGKAWGLASSLWEALLAWGAGGGPVEATASTASTATY